MVDRELLPVEVEEDGAVGEPLLSPGDRSRTHSIVALPWPKRASAAYEHVILLLVGATENAARHRQIRAAFTDDTIRVYQAYGPAIADAAVRAGTLDAHFKRDRMTWIKPSFLWMMYRSGWATKPGQERVLAIDITREGFEWALSRSCLSHFEPATYASEAEWAAAKNLSPVRVQWDPERSLTLAPLEHRAIQIGLSGEAVDRYVDQWVSSVTDITVEVHSIAELIGQGDLQSAESRLPAERIYPLPDEIGVRVAACEAVSASGTKDV